MKYQLQRSDLIAVILSAVFFLSDAVVISLQPDKFLQCFFVTRVAHSISVWGTLDESTFDELVEMVMNGISAQLEFVGEFLDIGAMCD